VDALKNEGNTDPMHLPDSSFQVEQRYANDAHRDEVRDEKHPASIFVDEIGESPKGSESNCQADYTKNVLPYIAVNIWIILIISY
jgi:hypothetical protein